MGKEKKFYGIPGVVPDTNNDGRIDLEKEVYDFLSGMPEYGKLVQILKQFPVIVKVTDIAALTADMLDALRPGDIVVKQTGTQEHSYRVAYKDATVGEFALVYSDYHTVEEVYYDKTGGDWAYITTEIVTLGGD